MVVIESDLVGFETSLKPQKRFLNISTNLLSQNAKPRKLRDSGVNFDQIFRKYFQKRSRGRKNGLKRAYNEGDMIFASLTTKTIF